MHKLLFEDRIGPDDPPFTFGMPIHILMSKRFFEWQLIAAEAHRLAQEVGDALQDYGLPYIDHLSTLANVYSALVSDEWQKYFPFGATDRLLSIAAVEAVTGQRAQAVARLTAAINERQEMLPKHWASLRVLLRRIQE